MASLEEALSPVPKETPLSSDVEDEDEYKEDEEAGDDTIEDELDDVLEAFKDIIDQVKKNQFRNFDKNKKNTFKKKYHTVLEKQTRDEKQTLLHMLAFHFPGRSKPFKAPSLVRIVRYLARRYPRQLKTADEAGKIPLYLAISKRNAPFVEAILEEVPKLKSLTMDQLLGTSCSDSMNHIHAAIHHRLDPKVTMNLVQKASSVTLCARDANGRTPLHLAVEYDRCSEEQIQLVELLLKKGDNALSMFTSNPKDLSVYEYHQYTRQQRQATQPKVAFDTNPNVEAKTDLENTDTLWSQSFEENDRRGRERSLNHDSSAMPYDHNDAESQYTLQTTRRRGSVHPEHPQTRPNNRRGVSNFGQSGSEGPRGNDLALGGRFESHAHSELPKPHLPVDITSGNAHSEDIAKRVSERRPKAAEGKGKDICADRIAQEVKICYLRSTFRDDPNPRTQHDATRFLYGSNIQNFSTCFDYSEATADLHTSAFEESYKHMKFDSVLRYVASSRVKLINDAKTAKDEDSSPKGQPGQGRHDLEHLFSWIKQKRVKYILKVVVDDLQEPPHSDAAIERCLEGLNIETLDWRKRDLCPETLYNACRSVRNLHLQWSGDRGILRTWGDEQGLLRLPKLKNIWVHWNADDALESNERTKLYANDFKKRMIDNTIIDFEQRKKRALEKAHTAWLDEAFNKLKIDDQDGNDTGGQHEGQTANIRRLIKIVRALENDKIANNDSQISFKKRCDEALEKLESESELKKIISKISKRDIKVEDVEESPRGRQPSRNTDGQAKSIGKTNEREHRWLRCMKSFAEEVPTFAKTLQLGDVKDDLLKKDITVALIDDGVDAQLEPLRGKIIGGETFDTGYGKEIGPSPYHSSKKGHGTVMAGQICRICPSAKLFVLKLETYDSLDQDNQSRTQITARSAALAVKAAVDRHVDIISMSWTLRKTKDNAEAISQLDTAIKRASEAGILIFCSAGDTGAIVEEEYPLNIGSHHLLRIGAASDDGRAWERAGSLQNLDFILPGHEVTFWDQPKKETARAEGEKGTGSSIAAALGAGLAAMILHCLRLGAISGEQKPQQNAKSATASQVRKAHLQKLKTRGGMVSAFKWIGLDGSQAKFVEVWQKFEWQRSRDKVDFEGFFVTLTNGLAMSVGSH